MMTQTLYDYIDGVDLYNYIINPMQAPSLLITLINMFLEIGSAPKVPNPADPANSKNEYSVFGPTKATAAVQVHVCACATINACLKRSHC